MDQYLCEPCGYIYDPKIGDPDNGIAPGTAFEDIPDDWVCPICGLGKDVFVKMQTDSGLRRNHHAFPPGRCPPSKGPVDYTQKTASRSVFPGSWV